MKNFIIIIFFSAIMFSSCDKNNFPIVFKKRVEYIASGTSGDYLIRYNDEYGKYIQATAKTTWEYEFKAKPKKYLFLSCTNNTNSGSVRVEVLVNGKMVLSDENSAPYGTAVVSGYVE